jgi:HEAT repeat protein
MQPCRTYNVFQWRFEQLQIFWRIIMRNTFYFFITATLTATLTLAQEHQTTSTTDSTGIAKASAVSPEAEPHRGSQSYVASRRHEILASNDEALQAKRGIKRSSSVPMTEDEKLALAAIESLLTMPPERTLPIIRKTLAGGQSDIVKERALFILGQMDSQDAQTLLLEHAKSSPPALRREAIRAIGMSGNAASLSALQPLYGSGDATLKREVLNAWLIAGRKGDVYQAAVNAKNEKDANDAIRMLSVMGATEELRKLGDLLKGRRSLIEAYAIAGDLTSLRKIADSNAEMNVRIDAVRSIGIIGKDNAKTVLREIYGNTAVSQLKDAALQGLLIANDQQGVLGLYRAAKTSDEKRTLLRTLSLMGGDAALAAIDSALESKGDKK